MLRRATLREPKKKTSVESAAPGENPLVPHLVLRQIYEKMVQARLLEERVSAAPLNSKNGGAKGKKRADSARGQEACRVAVVQGLAEGDLVAEAQAGPVMALLLGAELRRALDGDGLGAALPFVASARNRLHGALGAAMALRAAKSRGVVVAYVKRGEADEKVWKDVLSLASQQNLPMIFVVLPAVEKTGKSGERALVSKVAKGCQVPGMAVEASDAIALYRVAQESLGRIRGGGGPVLIECITYHLQGERNGKISDPVVEMREHLLERGAAQKAWIEQAGDRFLASYKQARESRTSGRRGKSSQSGRLKRR
jgi:acetoin:2,6-dichlorophenolindophenol oxidoreductase subunit alpha